MRVCALSNLAARAILFRGADSESSDSRQTSAASSRRKLPSLRH